MADKHRKGINLMKKISDKQAADLRLLQADADRRMKKTRKHHAM